MAFDDGIRDVSRRTFAIDRLGIACRNRIETPFRTQGEASSADLLPRGGIARRFVGLQTDA